MRQHIGIYPKFKSLTPLSFVSCCKPELVELQVHMQVCFVLKMQLFNCSFFVRLHICSPFVL